MLNTMKMTIRDKLEVLKKSGLFEMDFNNPLDYIQNLLYELDRRGKEKEFDVFDEKCYLKYIYYLYFQVVVDEMNKCLDAMVNYALSSTLSKIIHLFSTEQYCQRYFKICATISNLRVENVLGVYKSLLSVDGYFDFFVPGMYYKYTTIILNEMELLGLDFGRDILAEIYSIVKINENKLRLKGESVDFDTYNKQIKMVSDRFHVDFVSLNNDFDVVVEIDGEDPESIGGKNSV